MLKNSLLLKTKKLPNGIGVYFFLKNNNILYVGKSKKIKSRVLSYFNSLSNKHVRLISSSNNVDYILVSSEEDALFLENNLIKKHKPKYNILLKDDKSFPWICVKNEAFPRVFITRKKLNNSDFYFGPYTNKKKLKTLFELVKDLYPIRSCNYNLSEKNIFSKKYKVCLDYHLKKCLGPCEGFHDEKSYNKNIEYIKNILEGRYSFVLKNLKKKINYYSKKLLFEKCESLNNCVLTIRNLKNRSVVVSGKNINIDCFYILSLKNYYYINFTRVVEGLIVYSYNNQIKKKFITDEKHVLEVFIKNIFIRYKKLSINLISNISVPNFLNKKISIPIRGYKKSVLDFSFNNLLGFLEVNNNKIKLLSVLKKDLFLKKTPFHIECFDVSNLKGTNITASCVVFKNGEPLKSSYVGFFFKKTNIINDYLFISESIKRRYINTSIKKVPDLIVVDGGRGHLNCAIKALNSLKLYNVSIISIAKKEEIIHLKNNKKLVLNKKSKSLKLIQFLRNEAHRFCLKQHIIKRKNNFINSELYNISGIGNKTIFKLLKKFKSLNNLKKASNNDLINLIGLKKGLIIYNYFNL